MSTPTARALPVVGSDIDGKYAVLRVLGEGGMGIVFEAEHLRLKQKCAIKVLNPAMLELPEIVTRFEREARASAQLRGPHVTRVMDVETTRDGVPYIVMELLVGRDLEGELQARGKLPYPEAVDAVLQACAAIDEAHRAGIIHRDLKPGNLFLAQTNDEVIVKVLDFGISKVANEDATKLTGASTMIGTPLYMSPEQIRSAAKVDARSDIWSLGVILYELLTGDTPWVGAPHQVAAAIVVDDAPDIRTKIALPAPLAAAIHTLLRRDPTERFQSIGEVAAALVAFAPETSIGRTIGEQLARRAPSSRRLLADRPSQTRDHAASSPHLEPVRGATNVASSADAPVRGASASRLVLVGFVIGLLLVVCVFFGTRLTARSEAPQAEPKGNGGNGGDVRK